MIKRNPAIVALILSMPLLRLGLVFVWAAAREPSRYVPGFILLALGVGWALWSGMPLQPTLSLDPEHLNDRITILARQGGANEVTVSRVVAELDVPDEAARAALDLSVERGQCRLERRGARRF